MLYTNLKHIENAKDFKQVIRSNENVVIILGRMTVKCIPAYLLAEEMEAKYNNLSFYDMEVDNPESNILFKVYDFKKKKEFPMIFFFKKTVLKHTFCGVPSQNQFEYLIFKEF